jgi:hypothetical protein
MEDEEQALTRLADSAQNIDEQFLGSLISTAERFEEDLAEGDAERVRRLYREAVKISMKAKMGIQESEE